MTSTILHLLSGISPVLGTYLIRPECVFTGACASVPIRNLCRTLPQNSCRTKSTTTRMPRGTPPPWAFAVGIQDGPCQLCGHLRQLLMQPDKTSERGHPASRRSARGQRFACRNVSEQTAS
jgi:hypothetical protein